MFLDFEGKAVVSYFLPRTFEDKFVFEEFVGGVFFWEVAVGRNLTKGGDTSRPWGLRK